jgi:hypothetical protein
LNQSAKLFTQTTCKETEIFMDKALASAISIVEEKQPSMKNSAPNTVPTTANINPNGQAAEVRICTIDEYKALALSLAHAFKVDDFAMYFIDTPDRTHWTAEQKWDLHLNVMEYVVYAHLLNGLVTTAGENYGGVALW